MASRQAPLAGASPDPVAGRGQGGARASGAILPTTADGLTAPRCLPSRVKLLGQFDLLRLLFRTRVSHTNGVPIGSHVMALAPTEAAFTSAIEASAIAREFGPGRKLGGYVAGPSSERAAHSTPTGVEPPAAVQPGLAQQSSSIGHDIAAAAAAYWPCAMRQAGRSTRFCRHLGAPQTVLQHMIDEIAIGAARTGVVFTLTNAAGRPVADRRTSDLPLDPVAASRSHAIGTHLARLRSVNVPSADSPKSMSRSVQPTVADRALKAIAPCRQLGLAEPRVRAGMGGETTDKPSKFGGESWARAYAGRFKAKISAVSGLAGAAERDRVPGELLSGSASNPVEVEL